MAKPNCSACDELREKSPNLIVNGLGDTECTSLMNDTGLNPSSGNNDCTDLHNLNDCLIGNMEQEIDAYDVCDWKDFMRKFIENTWTTLKGIICAICGIWTTLHKLECIVNYLSTTTNVSSLLDASNFVPGTSVSFERQDERAIPPSLVISGSTYTVSGSLKIDLKDSHWGNLGLTNNGGAKGAMNTPDGNYTLCVIKIPKSKIPSVARLDSCVGSFVNAGISEIFVQVRDEGGTYPGQWGDGLITVPSGEMHIRIALAGLTTWGIAGGSDNIAGVTFRATGLAITNPNNIQC